MLAAAAQNLFGHAALLNALDIRLRAAEIVITGLDADGLTRAALALPFLERVVLRAPSADALAPAHPARDKLTAVPQSAAFVCVAERCSLPVTAAEKLTEAVAAMRA